MVVAAVVWLERTFVVAGILNKEITRQTERQSLRYINMDETVAFL